MKTKKINPRNKCGGKSTGCTVEFELPYGIAKGKVTDESPQQNQAGTAQTSR